MGKRGKGRRMRSEIGATGSSTQTSESPAIQVKRSEEKDSGIQTGEQSQKNMTEDQKSTNKGTDEATSHVQSVLPVDENIKFGEGTDKLTGDPKAADKFIENTIERRELGSEENDTNFKTVPVHSKSKIASALGPKNVVSEPKRLADKCFSTCAPPITAENILTPLPELLKSSKRRDKNNQKSDVDLKATKIQQELASENERKAVEPKIEVNEPMPISCCSENNYEQKNTSKFQCYQGTDEQKSEPMLLFPEGTDEQKDAPMMQFPEGTDEQKDAPMMQFPEGIDEQKDNSDDLVSLEVQQGKSSETKNAETKLNTCVDESTSYLQGPHGIDERKNVLEKERENIESKFDANEFIQTLQVTQIMDIDGRIRNLDLIVPRVQDVTLENRNKISELKNKEPEETINLKKDVNLRFEFDNLGNKKISVDDKVSYAVNERQKMTFDIGDGDVQLSFLGNNVSIFTHRSKIDCSIQKSEIIFSISDKTEKFDPLPEDLNVSRFAESKETAVVNDLGTSVIVNKVDDGSSMPSKIHAKSGSENIKSSVAETSVGRILRNITEDFLTSLRTSCENFQSGFIESLEERSEDTHKK